MGDCAYGRAVSAGRTSRGRQQRQTPISSDPIGRGVARRSLTHSQASGANLSSCPRTAASRLRMIILAGAALFAVVPAASSETITYSYDARGRLVKVVHSGNVNDGNTACYTYDKGDNRSNVTVATGSDCSSGGGGTTPPSFAVGDDSATEGTNVVFTITRSGSSTGSYSLSYATANGTAVAGSDYTQKSGTITFNDGIMSRNIAVATTDDTTVENSETFYLDISNPSGGATITDSRGNGTILDNDSTTTTCSGVSFAVSDASATEGGSLSFTITKSGTTSDSCSVSYATANNSAVAGSDYTSKSGTLTFSSSQTSQTVSVTTTDDTTVESAETMYLNLSSPSGSATISDSQGVGTINDNDTATNQPPVANFDDAGWMSCGTVITHNVVANDTDPDGNYPLSLVSASGSAGIMVSVANNTDIQILSSGSSSGTKSFSYVVQDSLGAQATGSGSVEVLAPCQ